MTKLPNDSDFIDASVTESGFKTAQTDMLAYLRTLLGSDGLAATARQNLGLASLTLDYVDRGAWATATAYNVNDQVTNGGIAYLCVIAHTSGTFSTDEAAGYWVIQQGLNNLTGLQTIADASALRATTPSLRRIWMSCHTNAGDGGHGVFRGVTGAAPATYVDNNGTIIVPTGGDGSSAWLRDYSGPVNVKWFGAVGDGAADDSVVIQAALTIGDEVLFPAGTYMHSATLTGKSNQRIVFDKGATLKATSAAALGSGGVQGLAFTSATNISVIGFNYDGNRVGRAPTGGVGGATGAHSLVFNGCSDVYVEQPMISNSPADGILISYSNSAADTRSHNVVCIGGRVTNAYRNGISITGARNCKIVGTRCDNTNGTAPEYGIDVEGDLAAAPQNNNDNVVIDSCYLHNNTGRGASLAGHTMRSAIINCLAANNGGTTDAVECWGLSDEAGTVTAQSTDNRIENNHVFGTIIGGSSIYGGILVRSDNTIIKGNIIDAAGGRGIRADVATATGQVIEDNHITSAATYGIQADGSIGVKIHNNTIDAVANSGGAYGILTALDRAEVVGNKVYGVEGVANWHIYSLSGIGCICSRNIVDGTSAAAPAKGIIFNGTNAVITDNQAYGCGTIGAGFMMDFSGRGWSKLSGNYDAGAASALATSPFEWAGESGKYRLTLSGTPTVGFFANGDRYYLRTVSAGGVEGSTCVTGGSPGTWKTFGSIAP